jgi:molybdopterin converting factor small subunit
MPITIQLPKVLAELAGGTQQISATGATLGDAVSELASRYPALGPRLRDAQGNPYEFVIYYLNDEDVRLNGGFAAPLSDGDEVIIVPAVAGG